MSMSLEELAALAKRLEELAKRLEASDERYKVLEAAMLAQEQTMAEILAALTKQGPALAGAIAKAMGNLTLTLPKQERQEIEFKMPPITIPTIKVPPATVVNDWQHLQITYIGTDGKPKTMDIKRVK